MFQKFNSIIVLTSFFCSLLTPLPVARAQGLLGLPEPGAMVSVSPAYEPAMIKGVIVHKDNPFIFDFIVDEGQDHLVGAGLKIEGEKLIKYFLAGLTIPEKDLWVNLSPYEKDRTIPEVLSQTEMGRDLLAQDYMLKQITASLIYPDKDLGRIFWDKVYSKARQLYGTTEVPVNTFNKVWITADRAVVYEHNNTAFVVDCHLKVLLEEDYLALKKHDAGSSVVHSLGSQIVREIILPELEKEVNVGKNFAQVRQIFNSIILSSWYKNNLKQALLNQVYANKGKVKGIDLLDKTIKEKIYRRYLQAYKRGVFNFIREDVDPEGVTIPRKYFSGGMMVAGKATHPDITTERSWFDSAMGTTGGDHLQKFTTELRESAAVPGIKINVIPPRERKHYLGTVYRTSEVVNGETIPLARISEIWDPLFTQPTLDFVVKQIEEGKVSAVFLKGSVIRQAEREDREITLTADMGRIPKNLLGTNVILGRTSTEILEHPVSDPLEKVVRSERVVVRAGGYFRIKIHDDASGEDLYLLTFNHVRREKTGQLKLTSPGGGARFAHGGKVKYSEAGLGELPEALVSPLDEPDPLAVRVKILGKDCWNIFLKLFNQGVGREEFLPAREFYEELVGRESEVHLLPDDQQLRFKFNGTGNGPQVNSAQTTEALKPPARANTELTNGGIDLNTQNMQWDIRNDGNGVEMTFDPAMIERVKREGIQSLTPVISRITPIVNIWPLAGLRAPISTLNSNT